MNMQKKKAFSVAWMQGGTHIADTMVKKESLDKTGQPTCCAGIRKAKPIGQLESPQSMREYVLRSGSRENTRSKKITSSTFASTTGVLYCQRQWHTDETLLRNSPSLGLKWGVEFLPQPSWQQMVIVWAVNMSFLQEGYFFCCFRFENTFLLLTGWFRPLTLQPTSFKCLLIIFDMEN